MADFDVVSITIPTIQEYLEVGEAYAGPAFPETVVPVVPDTTSPVVTNFSPVAGTEIASTDSIQFEVTDTSGSFARILVAVWFKETGVQELVHDGDAFTGLYTAVSSRVIITNGYRYTVAKSGGWGSSPTIRVFPIDAAGNEV
jgi:hypothetical protein